MANVNWTSLGNPPNVFIGYNATVAKHADGRLEAFVMDTGTSGGLWHSAQTSPGSVWNNWASLGAPAYTSNVNTTPCEPAVAVNDDDRLEVFIIGSDGTLWHTWELTPGGAWSQWSSLGTSPDMAGFISSLAVRVNADGRLEVFTISQYLGGPLWHIWQLAPGGSWSNWESLGTPLNNGNILYTAVGENADGRVEVFIIGSDTSLWHIWQLGEGSGWGKWTSLGTPPDVNNLATNCSVRKNDDGRMEVFVTSYGPTNALWHIWQLTPGGGWSAWTSLGAPPSLQIQSAPAVRKNKDGHLEAFATDTNGALWHIWQVVPEGNWGNWFSLETPSDVTFYSYAPPSVAENDDGRLEAFLTGSDGALWHAWQVAAGGNWG